MFGEMVGGKDYTFVQKKGWTGRLDEDLREFDIKSEGWRDISQKAGRWFRLGRGRVGGIHAEKARRGEGHYGKAKHDSCSCDMDCWEWRGRRSAQRADCWVWLCYMGNIYLGDEKCGPGGTLVNDAPGGTLAYCALGMV